MRVAVCIFSIVALLVAQMPQLPIGGGGSGGGGGTISGTGVLKGSGGNGVNAAYTDVASLWASGSCSGALRSDGTCLNANVQVGNVDILCAATGDAGCTGHGATGADTAYATTYTIPANTLVTGKVYRFTAGFTSVSTAVPTSAIKVKIGTATIYSMTATALVSGTSSFAISGLIIGAAAASATGTVYNTLVCMANTAGLRNQTAQPVSTVITNADQTITATLLLSAGTTGNTMTLQSLVVEPLN